MSKTLTELDAMLDTLEKELPEMIKEHPDDADFWPAFAGAADVIEDNAGDHAAHVRGRINCMLGSAGLIPSENEGQPCDD
ncbi:MAG TPA: hypothetical protein VGH81_12640 [Rudaea sp.]|jgi:hypothetical protein